MFKETLPIIFGLCILLMIAFACVTEPKVPNNTKFTQQLQTSVHNDSVDLFIKSNTQINCETHQSENGFLLECK